MGEVYQARDRKLERDVAIKVLPQGVAAGPLQIARFRREARMLAALNHPNIATVYGFEETDDLHCLVMELARGGRSGDDSCPARRSLRVDRQSTSRLPSSTNSIER